jgi:hypothetical protein
MSHIPAGTILRRRELFTIHSECIRVPDCQQIVHLQFRRFAGCPVCNLHLHSIVQRHSAILAASIREVIVFHTNAEELLQHAGDLPFAVIADPAKRLYAEFGVESRPRALLDPRVWGPIMRGVIRSLRASFRRQPIPSLNPDGGRFGLPAEFLIAGDGRVLALSMGPTRTINGPSTRYLHSRGRQRSTESAPTADHQIETSVVLTDQRWRESNLRK